MAKAMELLRKLGQRRAAKEEAPSAFDNRMQKLGHLRQVSVARSVLFRTAQSHSAA